MRLEPSQEQGYRATCNGQDKVDVEKQRNGLLKMKSADVVFVKEPLSQIVPEVASSLKELSDPRD
jgi:hypothetical protein